MMRLLKHLKKYAPLALIAFATACANDSDSSSSSSSDTPAANTPGGNDDGGNDNNNDDDDDDDPSVLNGQTRTAFNPGTTLADANCNGFGGVKITGVYNDAGTEIDTSKVQYICDYAFEYNFTENFNGTKPDSGDNASTSPTKVVTGADSLFFNYNKDVTARNVAKVKGADVTELAQLHPEITEAITAFYKTTDGDVIINSGEDWFYLKDGIARKYDLTLATPTITYAAKDGLFVIKSAAGADNGTVVFLNKDGTVNDLEATGLSFGTTAAVEGDFIGAVAENTLFVTVNETGATWLDKVYWADGTKTADFAQDGGSTAIATATTKLFAAKDGAFVIDGANGASQAVFVKSADGTTVELEDTSAIDLKGAVAAEIIGVVPDGSNTLIVTVNKTGATWLNKVYWADGTTATDFAQDGGNTAIATATTKLFAAKDGAFVIDGANGASQAVFVKSADGTTVELENTSAIDLKGAVAAEIIGVVPDGSNTLIVTVNKANATWLNKVYWADGTTAADFAQDGGNTAIATATTKLFVAKDGAFVIDGANGASQAVFVKSADGTTVELENTSAIDLKGAVAGEIIGVVPDGSNTLIVTVNKASATWLDGVFWADGTTVDDFAEVTGLAASASTTTKFVAAKDGIYFYDAADTDQLYWIDQAGAVKSVFGTLTSNASLNAANTDYIVVDDKIYMADDSGKYSKLAIAEGAADADDAAPAVENNNSFAIEAGKYAVHSDDLYFSYDKKLYVHGALDRAGVTEIATSNSAGSVADLDVKSLTVSGNNVYFSNSEQTYTFDATLSTTDSAGKVEIVATSMVAGSAKADLTSLTVVNNKLFGLDGGNVKYVKSFADGFEEVKDSADTPADLASITAIHALGNQLIAVKADKLYSVSSAATPVGKEIEVEAAKDGNLAAVDKASITPTNLAVAGDVLFFTHDGGGVWLTKGTTETTKRVVKTAANGSKVHVGWDLDAEGNKAVKSGNDYYTLAGGALYWVDGDNGTAVRASASTRKLGVESVQGLMKIKVGTADAIAVTTESGAVKVLVGWKGKPKNKFVNVNTGGTWNTANPYWVDGKLYFTGSNGLGREWYYGSKTQ